MSSQVVQLARGGKPQSLQERRTSAVRKPVGADFYTRFRHEGTGATSMGTSCRRTASCCLVIWLALCSSVPAHAEEVDDHPRDIGIEARVDARRVLLDVTVHGKSPEISSLTADDFEVAVGRQAIREFDLERVCLEGVDPGGGDSRGAAESAAVAPPNSGTSFLFYFDQPHLTMVGRERALDVARKLIPELITSGSEAMIVSSGRSVVTYAHWSSDHSVLLESLEKIRGDREQTDSWATLESERISQLLEDTGDALDRGELTAHVFKRDLLALGGRSRARSGCGSRDEKPVDKMDEIERVERQIGDVRSDANQLARDTARRLQDEDRWRTQLALSRFSMTLGRFADRPVPRAVIYFADVMRSNPGDHYLASIRDDRHTDAWDDMPRPARSGVLRQSVPTFHAVIDEAVAHGVRLYTIQAEGLMPPSTNVSRHALLNPASSEVWNGRTAALRDAKRSLGGLASETGGLAFLNGVRASKIAERILGDLACFYLISFDPDGLVEDEPLPVFVSTKRAGVKTRTRAQIVVQSSAARRSSLLKAAFLGGGSSQSPLHLEAIPTGFEDGRFSVLVQLETPVREGRGSTWDLGISAVSRNSIDQEAAGRISLSGGGVPAIFEAELYFEPGPFDLVAVAHEVSTEAIYNVRIEGSWPDPRDNPVTLGPINVLQPRQAVFVRDGVTRKAGSFGRSESSPIQTDLPTALVGIVCSVHPGRTLRVERRLVGDSSAEFPPVELTVTEQPCAVFSDLIRERTMTSGMFSYEVRVFDGEEELSTGRRLLAAVSSSTDLR